MPGPWALTPLDSPTQPPPGRLEFKNNLALNKHTKGMPDKSFTVEFWARGQPLDAKGHTQVRVVFTRTCLQMVCADGGQRRHPWSGRRPGRDPPPEPPNRCKNRAANELN